MYRECLVERQVEKTDRKKRPFETMRTMLDDLSARDYEERATDRDHQEDRKECGDILFGIDIEQRHEAFHSRMAEKIFRNLTGDTQQYQEGGDQREPSSYRCRAQPNFVFCLHFVWLQSPCTPICPHAKQSVPHAAGSRHHANAFIENFIRSASRLY